jgi:hypothetical protein
MTTKIPTEDEVEALRQRWEDIAVLTVDIRNHAEADYWAARKAHDAGPDTKQILDDAIDARNQADKTHASACDATNSARAAYAVAATAVREASAAHAKATR